MDIASLISGSTDGSPSLPSTSKPLVDHAVAIMRALGERRSEALERSWKVVLKEAKKQGSTNFVREFDSLASVEGCGEAFGGLAGALMTTVVAAQWRRRPLPGVVPESRTHYNFVQSNPPTALEADLTRLIEAYKEVRASRSKAEQSEVDRLIALFQRLIVGAGNKYEIAPRISHPTNTCGLMAANVQVKGYEELRAFLYGRFKERAPLYPLYHLTGLFLYAALTRVERLWRKTHADWANAAEEIFRLRNENLQKIEQCGVSIDNYKRSFPGYSQLVNRCRQTRRHVLEPLQIPFSADVLYPMASEEGRRESRNKEIEQLFFLVYQPRKGTKRSRAEVDLPLEVGGKFDLPAMEVFSLLSSEEAVSTEPSILDQPPVLSLDPENEWKEFLSLPEWEVGEENLPWPLSLSAAKAL